jgi:hypothetical protein
LDYACARGEIAFVKFGKSVRFIKGDVHNHIQAHRIGGRE